LKASTRYTALLLCATVLNAWSGTDSGTCETSNFQAEVLSRVNQIRAAGAVCGGVTYAPASPMRWNSKLQVAANQHSQDMASHNFFDHKSHTNGSTLSDRMQAVGYQYRSAGENISAGQTTVEKTIATWLASPAHCVTLMKAEFVDLGVSCNLNASSKYKTYWTLKAAAPN
jgi:uncharacterized protein YkwD